MMHYAIGAAAGAALCGAAWFMLPHTTSVVKLHDGLVMVTRSTGGSRICSPRVNRPDFSQSGTPVEGAKVQPLPDPDPNQPYKLICSPWH